jgi:uncharacterized membrane protein YqhA
LKLRRIEKGIVVGSRFLTLIAVGGSFASSLLMFLLGAYNIFHAFTEVLRPELGEPGEFGAVAVISVIEGLDRFLIGIVLLYFGYGVYTLFIHPSEPEESLALPDWLQIEQIGQLKQVVAEVIIVILLVLFLRVALEAYHDPRAEQGWEQLASIALLPFGIMLIALALRLVELHPKPGRRQEERVR